MFTNNMNVMNKKLASLRQWGKDKMSSDKDGVSQDFKDLETEMNLRHEGMEKLHSSMNMYIKNISKRTEGDGKEKNTPLGYMGLAMTRHGGEFEDGNRFGLCLASFGQAHESIARLQDMYAGTASVSWLNQLDRSLAQLKDYQNARKKLESRRSTYEGSIGKMQKAKREDFKAEEELRTQKAKYEESTEDVYRRMQDIIDAESENTTEMYSFLEAELNYHDRCREVLIQLKRDWPDNFSNSTSSRGGPAARSRTNTLERFRTNTSVQSDNDDLPLPPSLPYRSRNSSGTNSPLRENATFDFSSPTRPSLGRAATNDNFSRPPPQRAAYAEPQSFRQPLQPPRPTRVFQTANSAENVFGDAVGADEFSSSSPEKPWDTGFDRSSSPGTSSTSISRTGSGSALSTLDSASSGTPSGRFAQNGVGLPGMMGTGNGLTGGIGGGLAGKKAPPPPPPSRASKPKTGGPPPPPLKRSALSTTSVPYAAQS